MGLDGAPIACPTVVVCGRAEGPVLFVGAGAHGEEVAGVEAVRRAAHGVEPSALVGAAVFVPVQNPVAFSARTYLTPWDGGDLAKSFPGSPVGSMTERIAFTLFDEVLSRATAVIDVHSAMCWGDELPQCIVVRSGRASDETADAMARSFPVTALVSLDEHQAPAVFGPAYQRTLLAVLGAREVPVVLVESGEGGKWDGRVDVIVTGILNSLSALGMWPGRLSVAPSPRRFGGFRDVRAPRAGVVQVTVALGAEVRAGDVVARVVGVDEGDQMVKLARSETEGVVLRIFTGGVAIAGERLVTVGIE